jgi:3-oxoacyl-[acyl-carrier-protein] synthase II
MSMPSHADAPRRVVVTGLGVVAANGCDLDTFWASIRDGRSPARPLSRFDTSGIPSKIAAEITDFDPVKYMDSKSARRLGRSLQLSVAAARLAADDAGIDFAKIDADRCGTVEGSSLSNNESAWQTKELFLKKGYRAVGMSAIINGYAGAGSSEVAHELGIKGHSITCSTSSASGNDAVGYALSMIRSEEVDVMVAGGAEAPLIESVWAIMCLNRVLTRSTGNPAEAMKPFDKARDGFVLGEGAAYVVLEELGHALSRGARIYAELLAHGRSCEAYHPIAPHPEGIGVTRALAKAMRQANIQPSEVDYINAHATATEANDPVESLGIKKFFRDHARRLAVSSTKPITGHCLAAAGAIETVICTLALHHQVIPTTLNLSDPAEGCDLDYVVNGSRPYPIRVAVNLSAGFGGKHSCLVLSKFEKPK